MIAILHPPSMSTAGAGRSAIPGQLLRFGAVGGAASLVQLALFGCLASDVGSQLANLISWLLGTILATEGHRRYSFGGSRAHAEADHALGLGTSLVALVATSIALALLDNPVGVAGVAAVVAVNGLVGLARFVALRWWMVGRAAERAPNQHEPSVAESRKS